MLSEHIKAEFFCIYYIVCIALARRGKEKSVGEISLVEQTVEKIGLTVKTKSGNSVDLFSRDFTKCKIAFNGVIFRLNFKTVKIRIFGRPKDRIFRFDFNRVIFKFIDLTAIPECQPLIFCI